jgi:hypothetical protein
MWALLGAARPLLRAGDGLTAQSYGDDRIVRTGYITVAQSALYNFGVITDESSKLSIDNLVIIDHASGRPNSPQTGSVPLSAGSHRILLEYVQPQGSSSFRWLWLREGDWTNYRPVPSWAMSQRPISVATALIVRLIDAVRLISVIVATLAAVWFASLWLGSRREAWIAWGAPYRHNPTAFYFLLTLVCVALALGPPYGPWRYVYWLPGFSFIRGSSRFMVLGLLGIAVLAAIGFERLTSRLTARTRVVVTAVVIVLMAAEFAAQPFGVPYRLEIPSADRWVAQQPKPFVVAELPSAGGYQRFQTMYMLHSMAHWQKTVHGFSGIRPTLHEELYAQLRSFPSEASVRHLAQLDVTYVIVHSSWFSPEERQVVEERLPAFGSWLKLEYMDADSRVYSIHRPSKEES